MVMGKGGGKMTLFLNRPPGFLADDKAKPVLEGKIVRDVLLFLTVV